MTQSSRMRPEKESFGFTKEGRETFLYTFENAAGMKICATDLGAALVSVFVPDKDGVLKDVVLGYDDAAGYERGTQFLGAIVGRNANRIGKARLFISGKEYLLDKNEGEHNLHSGFDPYNIRIWDVKETGSNSITFLLKSPGGDQGLPGNAKICVTYTLTEKNEICIDYLAVSDADTIFNLTNHSYFNLDGTREKPGMRISDVLDHKVRIFADKYTPTDECSIPTGKIADVENTPMDFRKAKRIGEEIDAGFIQLRNANGYDHNWAVNKKEGFRKAAWMHSEKTGISLTVFTDRPGIQFYTANYLNDEPGKGGALYPKRSAACFETQAFPDAPNHKDFPASIVKAKEEFRSRTVFSFEIE